MLPIDMFSICCPCFLIVVFIESCDMIKGSLKTYFYQKNCSMSMLPALFLQTTGLGLVLVDLEVALVDDVDRVVVSTSD